MVRPPEELFPKEVFWREHYAYLKEHGYTLRDRYHPDWVPSWIKDPSKRVDHCEDSRRLLHAQVIDAVGADGRVVIIKDVELNTEYVVEDIPVGKHFSSPDLAKNPRNHCVPILDVLDPPAGSEQAFLVMPWLLDYNYPSFETIGEAVDFFRQIFEGLEFMHANNVAHG
ncbi:hypothetical protein H0H93_007651 [Arthromyces matolae]|nr:hypothetical protein H0H93_007651 [Arthromyces matolae]